MTEHLGQKLTEIVSGSTRQMRKEDGQVKREQCGRDSLAFDIVRLDNWQEGEKEKI